MPERPSRLTRFNRSMSFCKDLNLGRATARATAMSPMSTTTAAAMSQLRETLFPTAKMMPPMPMMGA